MVAVRSPVVNPWTVSSDGPQTFTFCHQTQFPTHLKSQVWNPLSHSRHVCKNSITVIKPAASVSSHRIYAKRVGHCGGGTRNPGKMESSWVGCSSRYRVVRVSHPWWSYPMAKRAALGFIFYGILCDTISEEEHLRFCEVLWVKPPDGIKLYPQKRGSWFTIFWTQTQVNGNVQFWIRTLGSMTV